MSAAHNDASHALAPDLGAIYLNKDTAGRLTLAFGAAGLIGLGLSGVGFLSEGTRPQALFSYLTAYFFVITLALGGMFFAALQHLVGAYWSVTVRRIAETMGSTLPVMVLFFAPIAISLAMGSSTLYPWASHELHNPLVAAKAPYLNVPFFLARAAVYLIVWGVLGTYYYRRSLALDRTGDPFIVLAMRKMSPVAILLFAWTLTFAGFDWLMSLSPTWYSTIFGVYLFAGTTLSSMSVIVLIALFLRRAGLLRDIITIEHYHDLGKLIFGFIVFWTYIAFSQYFLIWYANIPEETEWFAARWEGGWPAFSLFLVIGHFAVPFFASISRNAKRSPTMMAIITVLLVVMHYVDMYWLVMPQFLKEGPALSWLDLAAIIGLGGLFLALLVRRLGSAPLIPAKDPLLTASLEFENA